MHVDTRVRFELRHPQARPPSLAHPGDACHDLYLPEPLLLGPRQSAAVDLGLAIQLEPGWEAQIRGRSGLALRGLLVHPGTVDALYRQSLRVLLHNLSDEPLGLRAGDRVAQLKVSRVWEVEWSEGGVEPTSRGGLGSTGP